MFGQPDAKAIVQSYLRSTYGTQPISILDRDIIETPRGWVFFYNSQAAVDGDASQNLIGAAPIFVERATQKMFILGTGNTIEYYLREIEEGRGVPV